MFLFPVRVSSWYSCGAMHYLPLDVLFSFKVFQHSKIAIKCIECRGKAKARGRGERANEASNIVPVGLTLYTWAIYTMQTDKYTQFDFIYIVCIYTHAHTHRHMQQKYILEYRMSKYWHTDSHAISHPLYILLSIRAMNTSEYIRDCLNCSYRILLRYGCCIPIAIHTCNRLTRTTKQCLSQQKQTLHKIRDGRTFRII